jgi:AbiTii
MVAYYSDKLWDGWICHDAWQEIPKNTLVQVLDAVRNKTLRMTLEIREEVGGSDLAHVSPSVTERVRSIVINNLGGNVSVGDMDVSGQTVIIAGDRQSLDAALTKAGLDKEDLNELSEAILVDGGSKPGNHVAEWVRSEGRESLCRWIQSRGEHRPAVTYRLASGSCWSKEALGHRRWLCPESGQGRPDEAVETGAPSKVE